MTAAQNRPETPAGTSPRLVAAAASTRTEADVRAARRYCEDCRFCDAPQGMVYARCTSPQAAPVMTGDRFVSRELDQPGYAASQRTMDNRCGPDAKWFEPKLAAEVAA